MEEIIKYRVIIKFIFFDDKKNYYNNNNNNGLTTTCETYAIKTYYNGIFLIEGLVYKQVQI